jgi:alpha-tubulin suppressor-like RCC1 family protein
MSAIWVRLWGVTVFALVVAGFAHAMPTLDAGRAHNVAVSPSGQAWAWGEGMAGKLGNGSTSNTPVPVRAGALTNVVAVAAGGDVSAALLGDGTVWVWGIDPADNEVPWPAQLTGITGATAIAAGDSHVLVLLANGTVRAWGNNEYGQLGNGTVTDATTPVTVPGLSGVAAIAAGDQFSLALRTDGSVWAWGVATHGELGIGTTAPTTCPGPDFYRPTATTTCARAPVRLTGITSVTAIAARGRHALAVRSDGALWAWGSNHYGQLGDGTTIDRFVPYAVPGMSGVQLVAAGFNHSVVRRSDGNLWAWGLNSAGQLGVTSTQTCSNAYSIYSPACTRSPVQATAYRGAAAITAGGAHTIAVRADGTLVAFGANGSGQLGYGTANALTLRNIFDPHAPLGIGWFGNGTSLGIPGSSGSLNLGTLESGIAFPTQPVGSRSTALELWFSNIGEFPLQVRSVRAYGNFSVESACVGTLESDRHCSLFVTFRPLLPGERQGTLEIETDLEPAGLVTMPLSGMGTSSSIPVNYSDMWWNPAESGWGLTVSDHETALFAVWYTYESSGRPTWFVIPEGRFSADRRVWDGTIYSTTGPCYRDATFDPRLVRTTRVGTATLDFAPTDLPSGWARFSGSMGGRTWSRAITRLPFGNASASWGSDYTDIWWNASESGWGLALSQHGDNVFGVLFTYDCDGSPLFVTLPGVDFVGSSAFEAVLYTTRSTGSWWGSATFDPAHVTSTRAGTAWLPFTGRSAMFTTLFGDAMRTRTIVPQPFGHTGPGVP